MNTHSPLLLSRRRAVRLGLMALGLLLAGCAPQAKPAPGSWAEDYYRR